MSWSFKVFTHNDESNIDLTLGNRRVVRPSKPARLEPGDTLDGDVLLDRGPRRVAFEFRPIFDVVPPGDGVDGNPPPVDPLITGVVEITEVRKMLSYRIATNEGLTIDDVVVRNDPL